MITQREALEYEVASSGWAQFVSSTPLQWLCGQYFGWKVRLKYAQYQEHCERKRLLEVLKRNERARG